MSLRIHEGKTPGRAYPDNAGFLVQLPNRRSFSPDAAWYVGPSTGMKFLEGAPIFAVEVRSKDGYGKLGEKALAEKRADYFAAGTKVVWDVDTKAESINAYSISAPNQKRTFRRGEMADGEPALRIPAPEGEGKGRR